MQRLRSGRTSCSNETARGAADAVRASAGKTNTATLQRLIRAPFPTGSSRILILIVKTLTAACHLFPRASWTGGYIDSNCPRSIHSDEARAMIADLSMHSQPLGALGPLP